jgi:hypothetical protein
MEKHENADNRSIAMEVNYREYVDWFRNYNLNIRSYTLQEYICGQYTADMIAASEFKKICENIGKAGNMA